MSDELDARPGLATGTPGAGGSDDDLHDSVVEEMARQVALPIDEPPEVPPGERYVVGEVVGRGGMGTVHRASDRVLSRTVALKFLRDANPLAAARFQREARAQARVEHPNVCRVYDVGELEGRAFISMEYIAGPTLAEAAAEMSRADKVRVLRDVALAVHAAHEVGLVHRDLKPGNILLQRNALGELAAYVTDFGIARDTSDPGLTMTGQVVGTPCYMAPEQALGRNALIDARTDVYALGATLYELLGGAPPFAGATVNEVLQQIAAGTPPPLRRLDPTIPAALEDIVLRCLRPEPQGRYPSARAVADDLGRHLAGQPVRARRPVAAAWLWRHSIVVAAVLAVAAALAVVTRRTAPSAPWQPEIRDLGPVDGEPGEGLVFSRDGSQIAYVADRDGVPRVYVAPASGERPRAITPPDRWAARPRFTRDGGSILCRMEGGIFRVPLAGGAPEPIAPDAGHAEDCGDRLVILRGRTLLVREADGSLRERARFDQPPEAPSCDREGRRVVFALHAAPERHAPASIWSLDLDGGGEPIQLAPTTAAISQHPTFHPDGRSVLFSSSRGDATNLWELRLDGGPPVQLTRGAGPDGWPAVSPDGRSLAFAIAGPGSRLRALDPGDPRPRLVSASSDEVRFIDPSPDGRALALEVHRGQRNLVVVRSLADGRERILSEGHLPVWARDGSEVLWVDPPAQHLMAAPAAGGAARTLAEIASPPRRLVAADDGYVYLHGLEARDVRRVPLSGGVPEPVEGPEPGTAMYTMPASNLRVVWGAPIRFLPPGVGLHDPGVWSPPAGVVKICGADAAGGVFWVRRDDSRRADEIHRSDVAAGTDAIVARLSRASKELPVVAVAPDGTFYHAVAEPRVRRRLITNLADRPRHP